MIEFKNLKDLAILVIILLISYSVFITSGYINLRTITSDMDRTIIALNDSIKKKINTDSTVTYSKKAPEILLKDLTKSEYFKTLEASKQKYYKDLLKQKGLVSALQAELELKDSIIKTIDLKKDSNVTVNEKTLVFKKGSTLIFNDSSKNMKYNANIYFNDTLKFKLDYKYNLDFKSEFVKKDNDTWVNITVDDPNITIKSINSIKIPGKYEGKNAFEIFLIKNEKPIKIIGSSLLFGSGIYLGTILF